MIAPRTFSRRSRSRAANRSAATQPACNRGAGYGAAGGELAENADDRPIDSFAFAAVVGDLKEVLWGDPLDTDEQGGSPVLASYVEENVAMEEKDALYHTGFPDPLPL